MNFYRTYNPSANDEGNPIGGVFKESVRGQFVYIKSVADLVIVSKGFYFKHFLQCLNLFRWGGVL